MVGEAGGALGDEGQEAGLAHRRGPALGHDDPAGADIGGDGQGGAAGQAEQDAQSAVQRAEAEAVEDLGDHAGGDGENQQPGEEQAGMRDDVGHLGVAHHVAHGEADVVDADVGEVAGAGPGDDAEGLAHEAAHEGERGGDCHEDENREVDPVHRSPTVMWGIRMRGIVYRPAVVQRHPPRRRCTSLCEERMTLTRRWPWRPCR